VVVSFDGDDGKIRPFPCDVAWDSVVMTADGLRVNAVEPPCDALEGFYSATHAWNALFAVSFEELGVQPSCEATTAPSHNLVRLNPLWTTEQLQANFPGFRTLNGRKVVPGYYLEDYDVSTQTLSKLS